MGGSLELSVELALVAHFFRGLHLRGLQKMGILAEVLMGVDDGSCEQAMRRRASGASVRSWGRCGGPTTPVPSLVVAVGCHTPFRDSGNEASTRVLRMFHSHV
jgi:hypothetical protein